MKASKTVYVCSECDYQSSKWLGKCPQCNSWNTFIEETYTASQKSSSSKNKNQSAIRDREKAVKFGDFEIPDYLRHSTGISELDRVLGGGLVEGSVILIAGEPGIGKSTLLIQICGQIGDSCNVLYVSGEESKGQLKMRADRLGVNSEFLYVLTETNIDGVLNEYDRIKPDIMIVDSIQTMYCDSSASLSGSVTQVRECSSMLIERAKNDGASVIIVGHVNKEGGIAGPKVLEHMVDAVLYFEGDRRYPHRIVRAVKNRFGSTNEIGVFEMGERGLDEVPNPSAMLLDGRPMGVSGSCAVCIMEGSRPLIAEIQALVTPTVFPAPRRTSNGIDYNRMCLLLAVLEKRLGLKFSSYDVYLNVIGGLRVDEPAVDAAACLAMISSLRDIPVPDDVIAFGEVGLAGEFRSVASVEQRVNEAFRMGFTKIALPKRSAIKNESILKDSGVEIVPLAGIYDAVRLLREKESSNSSDFD
ncbi:MAG: DNA repair protein RadA [Ruminococcaceae bacterium]|nr:DNA repair protein RadA [Oscillospiraceae bacterium]